MQRDQFGRDAVPGGVFRRILVGYDASKEARRALDVAVSLAADLHGEAHALLVVRPPAHAETLEEKDRAAAAERENLSAGLAGDRDHHPGIADAAVHIVFADDPAEAISQYVEEHGFDLVVVGGHGREQMMHRGTGHSLEAILRRHPCPVLVV
jgi:nucleotide-binding universal stress UspA family protein